MSFGRLVLRVSFVSPPPLREVLCRFFDVVLPSLFLLCLANWSSSWLIRCCIASVSLPCSLVTLLTLGFGCRRVLHSLGWLLFFEFNSRLLDLLLPKLMFESRLDKVLSYGACFGWFLFSSFSIFIVVVLSGLVVVAFFIAPLS